MKITIDDIQRLLSHNKNGVCRFAKYVMTESRISYLDVDDVDDAVSHAKVWMLKQIEKGTEFDDKLHIDMSVRLVIRNSMFNKMTYNQLQKRNNESGVIHLGALENSDDFLDSKNIGHYDIEDKSYYNDILSLVFNKFGYNGRDVFDSKVRKNLSVNKIAKKLDISDGDVKSLYEKIITYVREFYKAEENRVSDSKYKISGGAVKRKYYRGKVKKTRDNCVPTDAFLLDVSKRLQLN